MTINITVFATVFRQRAFTVCAMEIATGREFNNYTLRKIRGKKSGKII
jgi:hypothetical protein